MHLVWLVQCFTEVTQKSKIATVRSTILFSSHKCSQELLYCLLQSYCWALFQCHWGIILMADGSVQSKYYT